MALVSPVPAVTRPVTPVVIGEVRAPEIMASRGEIVEESVALVNEDKIFVALGKEIEKNKSVLYWAITNSGGKRLCIIHVHQRAQRIPVPNMGSKFPVSSLKEQQVRAYWETERQNMLRNLGHYLHICSQERVQAERDYIERDSIENGILELISKHGIKKLVMGAAADKYYSRKMKDLKSKKAIFVREQAPASCNIFFICKRNLIHRREGTLNGSDTELPSPVFRAGPTIEAGENNHNGLESTVLSLLKEELHQSSPSSVLNDASMDAGLYDQTMTEAANSCREACKEALRRSKAEKDAIEVICMVKASEAQYLEELKRRKETEEALKKVKEEFDKIKNEQDEVIESVRVASNQTSLLKNQIAEPEQMVKELEEKVISAVQLLQNYKKERDELQIERDNALKEAEELRKSQAETSSVEVHQFATLFSFSVIEAATNNFDPSLKIGEGGYGSIYKGLLHHTQVAVKMLNSDSTQGPSEFQQEVDILSKMRHHNIITLLGTCPEAWTLIYEYLPNGSLEDRLRCKDNSPPLPWQTRIRIATELCSVLIFLHSCKPQGIVHGDLKPANILLDANFVTKLSDFGLCRLLSDKSVVCRTSPKGTFGYLDPEFYATGELTPKSDVYAFGIILLQLLTGRVARGIAKEVQYAIDTKRLKNLLDPSAGNWPFVKAEQLANLALSCCQMDRKNRPDLETEVWTVLEPMRASCGGFSYSGLGSEVQVQPPTYFICPIFQEIMQDPHVAADGYTYEAKAIKGWLDSDHYASPMTDLQLSHREIIPNLALRSAIREWLQQH
ncbi:hypothetical protein SLA2020_334010 [Shorea laevis]